MRRLADRERIEKFIRGLADHASQETRVYFTGGATAVLQGWRSSTIDVDILIVPDQDRILQALPRLKEELKINVELASPADFVPALPGWEGRSAFVASAGRISFYHYDFYAQALSKIERGHEKDLEDAREMVRRELVEPAKLLELYQRIEPELYRFPAIDPMSFRRAVDQFMEHISPRRT
ncbi:MAG TPA: DUF6036 family nucleotidyltransferase [Acidobacteriota bacterium]